MIRYPWREPRFLCSLLFRFRSKILLCLLFVHLWMWIWYDIIWCVFYSSWLTFLSLSYILTTTSEDTVSFQSLPERFLRYKLVFRLTLTHGVLLIFLGKSFSLTDSPTVTHSSLTVFILFLVLPDVLTTLTHSSFYHLGSNVSTFVTLHVIYFPIIIKVSCNLVVLRFVNGLGWISKLSTLMCLVSNCLGKIHLLFSGPGYHTLSRKQQ